MIGRTALRNLVLGLLLTLTLCFAGCFMTKYTLIDPANAKVDRAFVGDWNSEAFDATGREAGLVIRNIDDKLCYVEWRPSGGGKDLIRGVGFTTEVKGVTFVQLRGLEADPAPTEDWMLARVQLEGKDKLIIRQLSEEFFKKQTIGSAAQLRQVLESNVENDAMYAKDEVVTATRVAKQ